MASMKAQSADLWEEPTLDELMADPIIQLVMQRDGVKAADIHGEIAKARLVYAGIAVA